MSFQGAGGNVVKTLTFSEGATAEDDPAGTPQAIVAELVKAKGARRDPIDGVFMTTGDVEFIEGVWVGGWDVTECSELCFLF